ncbi:hypothetical protein N2152v2_008151 [Parachlorella kessleri]
MSTFSKATSPVPASTISQLAAEGPKPDANCCAKSKAFFTQATKDRCACDADYKHGLATLLNITPPCGIFAMVDLDGAGCGFKAVPVVCETGSQCVSCGPQKACVA